MSTVVYSLQYGPMLPYMKICYPSLRDWISRQGYELRLWTDADPMPDKAHPKFAIVNMLEEFVKRENADRMIFVDADVWVALFAPAWDSSEGFSAAFDRNDRSWARHWREKFCPQVGHTPTTSWIYRNSGVWSTDKTSAEAFLNETHTPWVESGEFVGWGEQHLFNVWLDKASTKGMKLNLLADIWNTLPHDKRPGYFTHFVGGNKEGQIQAMGLQKPEEYLSSGNPKFAL